MYKSLDAGTIRKRRLILPAALKLAAASVIYYVLRYQSMISGSFLWFLLQDGVGYIIVLGLHWYFIFKAVKAYFLDRPDRMKIRSGIVIGIFSSVLGRIISSLFLFWLVSYVDLPAQDLVNTYSGLSLLIAMFAATASGMVFGGVSALILKLQYS
jgi:hypothetical protein